MDKIRKFFIIAIFLIQSPLLMAAPTAEIRVGAFFPTSKTFKKLYGDCLPCYEINAIIPIGCSHFQSWVGFDYIYGSGHPLDCEGHTRINMYTLNCGVQYGTCLSSCFDAYIGIGPSFNITEIENKFCCIKDNASKFSFGGQAKSGVIYKFMDQLFIELFADYTYQRVHFKKNADISGFRTGLGLGYQF